MPRPPRYLVVDDEPDWLRLIERTFRGAQPTVEIVSFSRALDALDYLHGHEVDAIVTDLIMPEVHGFLLIEAVRQFDPAMPIVLISIDASVEGEALDCGANAFLTKSALSRELAGTVARLAPRAGAAPQADAPAVALASHPSQASAD